MKPNAEGNRPRIERRSPKGRPTESLRTPKRGFDGSPRPETPETLFQVVRAYFAEQDRHRGVYAVTGAGEFVPSSLDNVQEGLARLLSGGVLRPDHVFLDAGSGDGRVVILVSLVFGLRATGVEYDEVLWRRSLEHIAMFHKFYHGDGDRPQVLCGDFCDEGTYAPCGMAFHDFDVVFNYANDHHRLAAKIAQDGAEGALFLYYTPSSRPESFPGLIPVMSLALGKSSGRSGSFLHVYRKDD